jgi:hypothetical protein
MELVEKIREQNRIRARRYYDNHKTLISERRKASRKGDEPPKKEEIVEEPYSKAQLNKLNNEIEIIQQELKKLKTKEINQTPIVQSKAKKYNYSLGECIELIKENVEAKQSQLSYINQAKQIYDILGTNDLYKSLKQYKQSIYKIKTTSKKTDETSTYSVNSIKQIFQTVLKLITLYNMSLSENAIKEYKDEFDIYKIKSNDQTEKKRNEISLLSYDDYIKKVELAYGKNSREYLTVALYKINTFRDDLGQLLIVPSKPKEINEELNYLIVPQVKTKNVSILLNAYKTQKKYGQEDININKEYSKLIRDYIDVNELSYNDYLFGNVKSLSSYISKFNKKIGLNITINTIRKMKVSSALSNEEALNNPKIRLQVAKQAHHNPSTSLKSYRHKLI